MAGTIEQNIMPSPIKIEEDEQQNVEAIRALKAKYGKSVIVLAHHYQRLGVHMCGDVTGDSYALCKAAANQHDAKHIIFCGVRFMVTSAATLCRPDQIVYHPDRNAGCPMADMANLPQVLRSWIELGEFTDTKKVVPVVYMNSDLDLKSFCGERGGIVCTSSNARKVFDWSFARGQKIFFFPDEHLGRNTANAYGIPRDQIILWDPHKVNGGNTAEQIVNAKVILWKGYCHVHTRYTVPMIEEVRAKYPGIKIVVHPECTEDVVKVADAVGSTNFIQEYVKKMKPGEKVAIGTEVNMTHRLAVQNPDKFITPIVRSLCPNMFKISTRDLRDCLEQLDTWEPVKCDPREMHFAKLALDNMLSCAG